MADSGEEVGLLRKIVQFAFHVEQLEDFDVTKYSPSHRAFYPQFVEGIRCGFRGLRTTSKNDSLKQKVKSAFPMTAGVGSAIVGVLTVLSLLYQGGLTDAFQDGSWITYALRYANYVSLLMVLFLDKKGTIDDEVYFEASAVGNKEFSAHLQSLKKQKNLKKKLIGKARRVVQMLILRVANGVIKRFFPKPVQLTVLPVLRIIILRPALGSVLASLVAIADFFPTAGYWDEIITIVSETLMDSFSFGLELLDPYTKRMEGKGKVYLKKRYHGYISGMGLIYSVLARIPLMAPACVIAGEAGAADLTLKILAVNQTEDPRIDLLGQQFVVPAPAGDKKDN